MAAPPRSVPAAACGLLLAAALVGALAGCKSPRKRVAQPLTVVGGEGLYGSRCAGCHGADGRTAAAMTPRPRDLTDRAFQDAVTDEALAAVIVGGGAAVGKSAMMPAQKDLEGRPEDVAALVKAVRALRAP